MVSVWNDLVTSLVISSDQCTEKFVKLDKY